MRSGANRFDKKTLKPRLQGRQCLSESFPLSAAAKRRWNDRNRRTGVDALQGHNEVHGESYRQNGWGQIRPVTLSAAMELDNVIAYRATPTLALPRNTRGGDRRRS